MLYRPAVAVFILVLGSGLTACSTFVQTSSGQAYLARYQEQAGDLAADPAGNEFLQAAAVEPVLRFPARIGIARIDEGRLTAIPRAEAAAWSEATAELGPTYGEFLPISPLITALAGGATQVTRSDYGDVTGRAFTDLLQGIRLGAARQHADAVLIYEVVDHSQTTETPWAVTKLALVGFFIGPSDYVESDGHASAILVDVRNGYVYGQTAAVVEDAAMTFSTSINLDENESDTKARAKSAAAIALAPKVVDMTRALNRDLQAIDARASRE